MSNGCTPLGLIERSPGRRPILTHHSSCRTLDITGLGILYNLRKLCLILLWWSMYVFVVPVAPRNFYDVREPFLWVVSSRRLITYVHLLETLNHPPCAADTARQRSQGLNIADRIVLYYLATKSFDNHVFYGYSKTFSLRETLGSGFQLRLIEGPNP